jgi:tetratricopeptide (TPR) repeat protein
VNNVLRFWVAQVGVRERLAACDPSLVSSARVELERLLEATDANAARSLLSSLSAKKAGLASTPPNRVLCDLLFERCLQDLERGASTNLVDWYALAAEFGGLRSADSAHAKVLEGIARSMQEQGGAALCFMEALESYEALEDMPGLVVATALAAAEATARHDDIEKAKKLFVRASEKASEADGSLELCHAVIRRWDVCWSLVDSLAQGAQVNVPFEATDVWVVLKARAIRLLANEHVNEAIRAATAADEVGTRLGKTSDFLRGLTRFAIQRRLLDFAERATSTLVARGNGSEKDELLVVELQMESGQFAKAEKLAREVARRAPGSAAAQCALGTALLHQDRFDAALSAFGRAVDAEPKDFNAAHLLRTLSPGEIPGVTFDRKTGTMYVEPDLLSASGPDLVAVHMTAAIVRADPSQAESALAAIETEKSPEFMQAVRQLLFPVLLERQRQSSFQKAEALFQARRFDAAIAEYWRAIEEAPENNLAYMGIGDCYYRTGKFNLAVAFFEESLEVAPHVSTYRFLGDAHRRCGRLAPARSAYQAAIALNPKYEPARQQLAIMDAESEQDDG